MAVRTATRRWSDLDTFLREYPSTLRVGALVLPADSLEGEPAPELKVDLILPVVGRVGPVDAQVIARLPDGGVALRVLEQPQAVKDAIREVLAAGKPAVDRPRPVVATAPPPTPLAPGAATPAADPAYVRALEARVAELEAEVARLREALAAGAAAPGASGPARRTSRGFLLPDLQDAPPALEGALGDTSLRDALLVLASEKATGLLTVRATLPDGSARVRYGFWSQGGPVGWRTEPQDESEVLGVLLWRAGRLTKEQLEESISRMERQGIRQGEALVEMGAVPYGELVVYLQRQADYVFQRALQERGGAWSFHPQATLPEPFLPPPVRTVGVMFRAMLNEAKGLPAEDIAAALRPHVSRYVSLTEAGEALLADIKPSAEEQKFLAMLRKSPYRLRDLMATSPLSRAATAQLCWAMAEFGIVTFTVSPQEPAPAGAPKPAAPASAPAPASPAGPVPAELDALLTRLSAATPFERLGIHWICTGAEVEAARVAFEAQLAPQAAASRWGQAHLEAASRALARAREAYGQIADVSRRSALRAALLGEATVSGTAAILSRKGEEALARGAREEAASCFARALDLAPALAAARDGLVRAGGSP